MSKIIMYKNIDGLVILLTPTKATLKRATIKQIADKDVPFGMKYRITTESEIEPFLQYPRSSWLVSDSDLTDGVGNKSNKFEVQQ